MNPSNNGAKGTKVQGYKRQKGTRVRVQKYKGTGTRVQGASIVSSMPTAQGSADSKNTIIDTKLITGF